MQMIHLNRSSRISHHQVNHSQKHLIREKRRIQVRKRRIKLIRKLSQVVEEVRMTAAVMRNLTEGIPGVLSFDERFQ